MAPPGPRPFFTDVKPDLVVAEPAFLRFQTLYFRSTQSAQKRFPNELGVGGQRFFANINRSSTYTQALMYTVRPFNIRSIKRWKVA